MFKIFKFLFKTVIILGIIGGLLYLAYQNIPVFQDFVKDLIGIPSFIPV